MEVVPFIGSTGLLKKSKELYRQTDLSRTFPFLWQQDFPVSLAKSTTIHLKIFWKKGPKNF